MSSELIISIKLYRSTQYWINFIIILYQCIPTGYSSSKEQKFGLISVHDQKNSQPRSHFPIILLNTVLNPII